MSMANHSMVFRVLVDYLFFLTRTECFPISSLGLEQPHNMYKKALAVTGSRRIFQEACYYLALI